MCDTKIAIQPSDPADTQVTRHGLLYTLGWAQLIQGCYAAEVHFTPVTSININNSIEQSTAQGKTRLIASLKTNHLLALKSAWSKQLIFRF